MAALAAASSELSRIIQRARALISAKQNRKRRIFSEVISSRLNGRPVDSVTLLLATFLFNKDGWAALMVAENLQPTKDILSWIGVASSRSSMSTMRNSLLVLAIVLLAVIFDLAQAQPGFGRGGGGGGGGGPGGGGGFGGGPGGGGGFGGGPGGGGGFGGGPGGGGGGGGFGGGGRGDRLDCQDFVDACREYARFNRARPGGLCCQATSRVDARCICRVDRNLRGRYERAPSDCGLSRFRYPRCD